MRTISDKWIEQKLEAWTGAGWPVTVDAVRALKQIQRDRAAIRAHRDTIIKSGKEGLDRKLYKATLPEEGK